MKFAFWVFLAALNGLLSRAIEGRERLNTPTTGSRCPFDCASLDATGRRFLGSERGGEGILRAAAMPPEPPKESSVVPKGCWEALRGCS